jgi:release factor glutamine methyltransferase
MAHLVLERVFDVSQTDVLREKAINVDQNHQEELDRIVKRINSNEPIQYILNTAYFFGRTFFVDEAVLIPRPETEELVSLVMDLCKESKIRNPKILDIGTGSGCIPITLSLELPASKVYGLDKSKSALAIAKKNAETLDANVTLLEVDILSSQLALESFHIIVSNPPYIPLEEKSQMRSNVTDFEPHMALFVDDHDPLVFYSAIAQLGKKSLDANGFIAVEINERFGRDTKNVFDKHGYADTKVVKDISGKNRFVIAKK